MIINTGQRTDIPAFFPLWLATRIKEGFILVRNPYNPSLVTRYEINPQVVDAIGFCTKNPEPFFPYLEVVKDFGQFWYITITPYGKDIEPGLPENILLIFICGLLKEWRASSKALRKLLSSALLIYMKR